MLSSSEIKAETPAALPLFERWFKEMGIPEDQRQVYANFITEGKFSLPTAILENKALNFKCIVIEPAKTAEQHMHELLEIHNQFYTGVYYVKSGI